MVPDGEVLVVWLERDIEDIGAVGGVVEADDEVSVVPDVEGDVICNVFEGYEALFLQLFIVLQYTRVWRVGEEDVLCILSNDRMHGLAEGSKGVQGGLAEDFLEGLDRRQG